jgi:hypothetical protein
MNSNTKHQITSEQQNGFAHVCLASCRKLLARLENAKANIIAQFSGSLQNDEHVLQLALNEAEALAWQTDFPQLVFPTLAMEKAEAVQAWHQRQKFFREHGSLMLAAA